MNPVEDWFAMLPLDTQEVEGANSIIKKNHQLAPNIKLPLMSDRVLIKKSLGKILGNRQARMDAIDFAVHSHSEALVQVQQIKQRFRDAYACGDADDDASDLIPLTDGGGGAAADVLVEAASGPQASRRRRQTEPAANVDVADASDCPCYRRMVALLQASAKGSKLIPTGKSCFSFSVRNLD